LLLLLAALTALPRFLLTWISWLLSWLLTALLATLASRLIALPRMALAWIVLVHRWLLCVIGLRDINVGKAVMFPGRDSDRSGVRAVATPGRFEGGLLLLMRHPMPYR
jgi:hypothetical protein